MISTQVFLVHAFRSEAGRLVAEMPIPCRSAEQALYRAGILAERMAGVIALAVADPSASVSSAEILFKAGRVPEG